MLWRRRPLSVAPAPRRSFHGPYAALGGAYGVSSGFSVSPGVTAQPKGGSVLALGGYNFQMEHLVLGLEIAARYSGERDGLTKNEFGITGSARIGAAFADTLIFAHAGVGIANMEGTQPTVVMGLGVEQNFWSSGFVRVGIDFEGVRMLTGQSSGGFFGGTVSQTQEFVWTSRFNALVGTRY